MTKTTLATTVAKGVIAAVALAGLLFLLAPVGAHAAAANASLGGGNALARATTGQSQGLTHASSTSDLLAHLTFASTRGGKPTEVPPANSNAGGNGGEESGSEEGSTEGSQDGNTSDPSAQDNASGNASGNQNNGGASSGNGGNGGDGAPGGLVVAGGVVSNAHAVNVLNVNLVRISAR